MRVVGVLVIGLAACLLSVASSQAEITPEQRKTGQEVTAALDEAVKLSRAKKYEELGQLVVANEQKLDQLAASDSKGELKAAIANLRRRLATYRRLAKSKGVELPDEGRAATTAAGAVSFTTQVAPVLVSRCGNCHVRNARGMFSMATYESLLAGPPAGPVIKPEKAAESRMIEMVSQGEMPPSGNKLPADEIALLTKWIDAGAKFDGPDPATQLLQIVPQPNRAQRPTLAVTAATGKEQVLFSRDIAPVLAEHCTDCHGGTNPRANLSLETFRGLLDGGDSELALLPGKGADSLIVRKLKGDAGDRMPLQRPPLGDDVIARFETWINDGAKFDGPSPLMATEMVANVYKARMMSADELGAHRATLAMKNWQLGNPGNTPRRAESANFIVLGDLPEEQLAKIAELAEEQQAKIARTLRLPADQPLIKGRITLFVFSRRFDYNEYSQMVEKRPAATDARGHWRFDRVDAYACVVPPKSEDEYSLAAVIGAQVAGIYIDSLGTVPRWFSEGSALAVAARLDPKDPDLKRREDRVPAIVRGAKSPDAFLTGGIAAADVPAANYSFVSFLMSNQAKYNALLAAIKQGAPFDQALERTYGGNAKALATAWARQATATARGG
jgi:mono/diheme cytochrome c family protein